MEHTPLTAWDYMHGDPTELMAHPDYDPDRFARLQVALGEARSIIEMALVRHGY